jgi:phage tail-like protein
MSLNPTGNRAYSAAHFALSFDGNDQAGLFRSVEGGGVKADVMTYQHGATYERWRQLGKPKFDDLKVQVGMSMSDSFYGWIADFFAGNVVRKDGQISAADFYYKERARRKFTGAMIKELTFPKLDGSDKNPVYMTLGVAVEDMQYQAGDNHVITVPNGNGETYQKNWTACNFEMVLEGIEESSLYRVSKIDSFTIKHTISEYHTGKFRAPTKHMGPIEFPTVTFYVPEVDAAPIITHFETRGIKGEVPTKRLTGHIQTFDQKMNSMFTLNLMNCDIASYAPDKSDASSEEIKLVKFEMYVESMEFDYTRDED